MDMHDTHRRGLADQDDGHGCECADDRVKVGERECPEHGWQGQDEEGGHGTGCVCLDCAEARP